MSETSEKKRKQLKIKKQCSPCGCVPRAKKRKNLKGGAVQEEDNERDEYIKTSMVKKKENVTTEGPVLTKDLPEILVPGTCISIDGFVKENAKRFAINLMCGKEPHNDIALHLNPRLSLRCIVRNHRIKNGWGGEETTAATKFDIKRGQPFSFYILLTSREYFVALNGNHFCAFVYRIPLNHVKFIQVDGDVEITKCEFSKEREYPIPLRIPTKSLSVLTGEGLAQLPEREMATPLTAHLEQGFEPYWQLEIYGRVKILPSSFYINLQDGGQIWPHPTIHLHLNSRFSHTDAFICNAWRNGEWGQEERTSSFLFTPSKPFSLAIRKLDHHFAIWVDGKLVSEFKFRGPATHIRTVVFNGDIAIQAVYMNKKSDDRYFNKWREKIITETL